MLLVPGEKMIKMEMDIFYHVDDIGAYFSLLSPDLFQPWSLPSSRNEDQSYDKQKKTTNRHDYPGRKNGT